MTQRLPREQVRVSQARLDHCVAITRVSRVERLGSFSQGSVGVEPTFMKLHVTFG